VNGFCTSEEYSRFMLEVNYFEKMITSDGIHLIKFYFSITKDEQKRRFEEIRKDPLKRWKLSPVDEKAQELWPLYTEYKEKMFEKTHTEDNPWIIIKANRKSRARMEAIQYILNNVPYI
jgi:polyphosphate kinase 2 (PPK2 family)